MHKALTISELTTTICWCLDASTLAALARSCKTLHEPAIRNLWADLPDLVPLVKTLPEDSWAIEDKKIRLSRPLLPSDWDRLREYGQFVKTLGDSSSGYPRIRTLLAASSFATLCAQKPVGVLLPRLRSFNWDALHLPDCDMPMFASLLGSNLRKASIGSSSKESSYKNALAATLAVLSQHSTQLRQLRLDVSPESRSASRRISSALVDSLPSFRHLAEFQCLAVALTQRAVTALASLPELTECALRLPESRLWLTSGAPERPFPKLTQLSIIGSVAAYAAFSRALSCSQVTVFDFDVDVIPDSRAIPELFSAIRRQLSPDRLESLAVYTSPDVVAEESVVLEMGAVVHPDHFNPLLDFTRLRMFAFNPPWAFKLSDILVLSMAKAWPSLEDFSLANEPVCIQVDYGATLRSLATFAAHSPIVESIAYPFDAVDGRFVDGAIPDDLYGDLLVKNTVPSSSSRVREITVQRCPITRPDQVAVFLSVLFPKLAVIDVCQASPHDPGYRDEYGSIWKRVSQHIGGMSGEK